MIEQFNFDIRLIFAILNGKDNMERQHLVVRISDKKDRRTNLIHLTKDGKELEEKARIIAGQTLKEALHGITLDELSIGQEVLKKVFYNTKD